MVEESLSIVDLYSVYTGIQDGSIEAPSSGSRPFIFPETFREQPFSVSVGSKHCDSAHDLVKSETDIHPTCASCLSEKHKIYESKRMCC